MASETTVGGARSLTYYRSVMVYAQSGSNAEQLQYILHPEGMAAKTTGAFEYRYFKADHLGSTRVMLTANCTTLRADQTTDYYPLGLSHGMSNTTLNKYLYGGKELQDAALTGSALQLYDFHARFYNPVYGRWFNPDSARQFNNPYVYCANSPMMYIDPDGQYAFIDDLIAGVVGGVVNLGVNLISGNITSWEHAGFSFLAGAAGGISLLYAGPVAAGALLGGLDNTVNQNYQNGGDIDLGQVIFSSFMGGATAAVGQALNQTISPTVNQLTSSVIPHQGAQMIVSNAISDAASGGILSMGIAGLNGASFDETLDAGLNGALFGLATGTTRGTIGWYSYAQKNNLNPWTGKAYNVYLPTGDGGVTDIRPTLERIERGRSHPHRNDGSIFENRPPKGANAPLLPQEAHGYYREYVHPTPGINSPGVMRIVTGANGELWYSPDHYKTFIPIKK